VLAVSDTPAGLGTGGCRVAFGRRHHHCTCPDRKSVERGPPSRQGIPAAGSAANDGPQDDRPDVHDHRAHVVLRRWRDGDADAWRAGPARSAVVSPERYNQLFTTHGTIMLLFFVTPMLFAFANLIMPLQIGALDVAFSRPNAFSYWLFVFGRSRNHPVLPTLCQRDRPRGGDARRYVAEPVRIGILAVVDSGRTIARNRPALRDVRSRAPRMTRVVRRRPGVARRDLVPCARSPLVYQWRSPNLFGGDVVSRRASALVPRRPSSHAHATNLEATQP
jgi:Cytochrome C and Quinol oxidase polypeptide I